MARFSAFLALVLSLTACGDDDGPEPTPTDAATPDLAVADDAAVPDGGADAGEVDAFVEPATTRAFVFTGHMQRRMLTCDDGETFVYDVSADDDVRCWNMAGGEGPDCDHHPTSNNGAAYGAGRFVTTSGWGAIEPDQGGLWVSDGANDWTQVSPGVTYNGVAFGNDVFVANAGRPAVSRDGGETWEPVPENLYYGPSRGAFFAPVGDGVFVMQRDLVQDFWFSDDDGATFWQADSVDCTVEGGLAVAASDAVLFVYDSGDSAACRSTDGGHTWTAAPLPEGLSSSIVWTGTELWGWGAGKRFRSVDGTSWEEDASEGGGGIGRVLRAEDGTLLGVVSRWGGYYGDSHLYRSTDGLVWTETGGSAALNGHPIRGTAVGEVPVSVCE